MQSQQITPKDQPPPTASVSLITTMGQILLQLWARECPNACRNFIKLGVDGDYNGGIFYRMIPGFMLQGGMRGKEGQPEVEQVKEEKGEFHQRLKFGRRGMIGVVKENKSQFFITFGQAKHLDGKNTVFGRVVGDSVYNLMAMQSLQTDKNDRPLYPPVIKKVKIILNPFDDIIPKAIQNLPERAQIKEQQLQKQKKAKKSEIKKLKNKNKLTFDVEQQNQQQQMEYKIKSSHDTLNDQKLSRKVAITQEQLQKKRRQKQQEKEKKKQIAKKVNEAKNNQNQNGGRDDQDIEQILKAQLLKKKRNIQQNSKLIQDQVLNYRRRINPQTGKVQLVWGEEMQEEVEKHKNDHQDQQAKIRRLRQEQQNEYQALKAEELNFKKLKQGSAKQRRKQLVAEEKTLLSNVQKKRYEYLKKSQTDKRQGEVLSKLNKFTQRLKSNDPNDWMCHNLKFHIDSQNAYNLDKKNQQRKMRNDKNYQDQDDGGLKVQYDKLQPIDSEIDLQQLYKLAKDDSDNE